MNLTSELNDTSSKEKQHFGADLSSGGHDLFATDGSLDLSDAFLLGGNTWDYNNCSMIPENYFNPKMFEEETDTLHSPKALKADDGQAIPKTPMKTEPRMMENKAPVTKAAANVGNAQQSRRRSGGPSNASTQNWYNICQQPNTPPVQSYQPTGLAYAQTSPYLEWNAAAASAPNGMMAPDPYSWMHSGRPKRAPSYGFPMTSPPMIYQNGYGMFGGPPQSPQFGFVNPMFMVNQTAPKLPVQALPPRPETIVAESHGPVAPMMAPLVLPADLGKRRAVSEPEIDPTAISSAISAALSRSTAGNDEAGGSPTSSNASLSPSGIPSSASQMDNMKLYESTFESFVKEEAAIDYTNVTVIELKKLLRKYHLAATGKKEELIRLVKDVAQFLKGSPPKADAISSASKIRENENHRKATIAEDRDYTKFFDVSKLP